MSRQAYYQQVACQQQQDAEEERVVAWVKRLRMDQPRIGTRKLHYLLKTPMAAAGIRIGRDALFDLLHRVRLLVPPRRAYHKTTDSHHRFWRHPNLLKAGMQQRVANAAEQVWVADITYLPTAEKCVYLSLVTDTYSRKIVGYHVHEGLQTEQVSQALKMAVRDRQTSQALIHHSDRGIQYCSAYYQAIHQRHGITCSMTDGYDCYQNAMAERVNGILKMELLLNRPANYQDAVKMVRQSIQIYNERRPHTSLKYKTPDEIHRASVQQSIDRQTVNQ